VSKTDNLFYDLKTRFIETFFNCNHSRVLMAILCIRKSFAST